MTGKRVAITGATSGIGAELALHHASRGDDVVLLNRSIERSQPVVQQIEAMHPSSTVAVIQTDLADRGSLRAAAERIIAEPVDLFYNNAGVLLNERQTAPSGVEMHAEVNALAPYQFGRLLAPNMRGGTMILVSTGAIKQSGFSVDQLADPDRYGRLFPRPYGHSKLAATIAMTVFATEYPEVTFRSYAPGPTKTSMSSAIPRALRPLLVFFGTAEDAAAEIHEAATRPGIPNGAYLQGGKVKPLPDLALDPDIQSEVMRWFRQHAAV